MNKFKAIGAYIFGGSQTCAHLQIGWNVDRILEMTETMDENNAYHFIKNYPDIPVVKPSEWCNQNYLDELKKYNYDLLFANNPCSGLSSINKNANVNQPINDKFFEIFNIIDNIEPKVFLMENAPALVTIGLPILQSMVNLLNGKYNFTIIRDKAGNHNVCMNRTRTLVIGWRKDLFNEIPIIDMKKKLEFTVKDALSNLSNNIDNTNDYEYSSWNNLNKCYKLVEKNNSVLRTCLNLNENEINHVLTNAQKTAIKTARNKLNENKNIWDKSPWRLDENKKCASITSVSRYLHPIEDRELNIREYARLMGYPDNFKFYPSECKCSTIQCIAQGVPVNFIKYISTEIKNKLINNYNYDKKACNVIYQNHIGEYYNTYFVDEFIALDKLNEKNNNSNKLKN